MNVNATSQCGIGRLTIDHPTLQVIAFAIFDFIVRCLLPVVYCLDSTGCLLGIDALQTEVINLEPTVAVVRGTGAVGLVVAGADAEFQALAVLERHHHRHGMKRHLA